MPEKSTNRELEQRIQELEQKIKEFEKESAESKRAELKLKDALSETQRFREAMDHVPAFVFMKDRQSRYVYANRLTLELFGCSAEELVGRDDTHFFPHDTVKRLRQVDSRVFAGEQTFEEIDVADAGVKRRTYWEVKTPIYVEPERKTIWGLLGISTDITKRKQTEEVLKESEQFISAVFDSIQDGISILDQDLNIVRVNQAMRNWYSHMDPLEGKKCYKAYRGRSDACEICPSLRALKTGKLEMNEVPLLQSDGLPGTLELFAFPMLDESGKPSAVVEYVRNITDQKRAEEEVVKLAEVVKHSSELINLATLDGRMIFLNDAGGKMLGIDPDQVQATQIMEVIPDHLTDLVQNEVLPAIMNSGTWKGELQYRNLKTHKNTNVYAITFTVNAPGTEKPQFLANVSMDITELKQMEEEKRQALEFAAEQSKHALIGQVAGKMAHDFNNVLMGIMGNAQLAILDCSDEKIKGKLELINDFSERGRDITNTLMSFSKDQEPKQNYFKIVDKIELVLKMLEKDLTGIEVNRNYKSGIPKLLADPGMIQDVLANLVQNSIHAMSKVENPTLNLKAYSQDDKICFEIEDNGCGIPKEHKDSIYTPSFTLKGSHDKTGSYKPDIKGTGYGMSNVNKYIVEKHKGDISLDSKFGKGTKVTISLKAIKDHLSSDEKKEVVKSHIYEKRRILLVEDEHAIADVQYQILTKEPFSHIVTIAVNGQMAIDIFDRNEFDAVSLDYMLPGKINGVDVYNHIREKDKDIPIMFISGNIEFLESIKMLKEKDPNIEHLSKPVGNLGYVNKINELLGSRI